MDGKVSFQVVLTKLDLSVLFYLFIHLRPRVRIWTELTSRILRPFSVFYSAQRLDLSAWCVRLSRLSVEIYLISTQFNYLICSVVRVAAEKIHSVNLDMDETKLDKRGFCVAGPSAWNSPPSDIFSLPSNCISTNILWKSSQDISVFTLLWHNCWDLTVLPAQCTPCVHPL